jgi:hypothetical protein
MTRYPKDVTLIYANPLERQAATPIAAEAERRGYRTCLTDALFKNGGG